MKTWVLLQNLRQWLLGLGKYIVAYHSGAGPFVGDVSRLVGDQGRGINDRSIFLDIAGKCDHRVAIRITDDEGDGISRHQASHGSFHADGLLALF